MSSNIKAATTPQKFIIIEILIIILFLFEYLTRHCYDIRAFQLGGIMQRFLITLALFFSFSLTTQAFEKSYFELKKIKITDETDIYKKYQTQIQGEDLKSQCTASSASNSTMAIGSIESTGLILDQIMNLGKEIIAIIKAGRPVTNMNIESASALPRGTQCWTDLTGWNSPQEKVFHIQYENGLGMTVIDFVYSITFTAGGSANGVGKYITHATVIPKMIDVAWGWSIDAEATIPSVYNMGTRENPIAAMQLNFGWKVTTDVTYSEKSFSYFISGDNNIVELD